MMFAETIFLCAAAAVLFYFLALLAGRNHGTKPAPEHRQAQDSFAIPPEAAVAAAFGGGAAVLAGWAAYPAASGQTLAATAFAMIMAAALFYVLNTLMPEGGQK